MTQFPPYSLPFEDVSRISSETSDAMRQSAQAVVAGVESEYISGVGKLEDRLLILIDLDKLLSETEKGAMASI